jgi:hypothetical protein
MIDFGNLTPAQKRRIEKVWVLYFVERRDRLAKYVVDKMVGSAFRLYPRDKACLMVDLEMDYATWDKVVNGRTALKREPSADNK